MRPYLEKNTLQKRAGEVAQGISPEFKPQYQKKKKNQKRSVRINLQHYKNHTEVQGFNQFSSPMLFIHC
jgi:hypothetical protein